jgi:integrase
VRPRRPYEVVAAALARRIAAGELAPGDLVASAAELAAEHDVSLSTAKRALVLTQDLGRLARAGRSRLLVAPLRGRVKSPRATTFGQHSPVSSCGQVTLDLVIRHRGDVVAQFSSAADPSSPADLQQILSAAVLRDTGGTQAVAEYEMDVFPAGSLTRILTFVASSAR